MDLVVVVVEVDFDGDGDGGVHLLTHRLVRARARDDGHGLAASCLPTRLATSP